jgi:mannitol-1-phosphate/altronate dehydrogenase
MDVKETLTKTKAGRRFVGFMRAVNTGDPNILRAHLDYIADQSLEHHSKEIWQAQLQYIHAITGGLKAIQVMASDEYQVVVLMQAHKDSRLHVIDMAVEEDYPHKVVQFVQRIAGGE